MNLLNFIDVSVNIEIVIGTTFTLLRLVNRPQFVLIALTNGLNCRLFNKTAFIFWLRKPWNRRIILDIKLVLVVILHAQVVASIMIWLLICVHRSVISVGGTGVRIESLLLETVELWILVLIQNRLRIFVIELQVLKSPSFFHFDVWIAILQRWILVPLSAVILLRPLAIFIFVIKAVFIVHCFQLKVLVAPSVAIVRVHYLKVSGLFAHLFTF